MTDQDPAFDYDAAFARIEAQEAERSRAAAEAFEPNKAALFDVLAAAGITSVVVTFDGSGDSGQIEEIYVHRGDEKIALPTAQIAFVTPLQDGSGLEHRRLSPAEAVEEVAYELLRDTHPGWEINEGGLGEFTFDVAERSIELDFYQRIETAEHFGHSW